jgi:hypothetical protein
MTALFWQFSYLQVLDLLTTLAFLCLGATEGNPLVRFLIMHAPSPFWGLAAAKIIALILGVYCLKLRKARLLTRINFLFGVVVAWNLIVIVLRAAELRPA